MTKIDRDIFEFGTFEFWICFEFRYSNFGFFDYGFREMRGLNYDH
jgi:hypothetical protein